MRHWIRLVQEGKADVRDTSGGVHHVCPDTAERMEFLNNQNVGGSIWRTR